MPSYLPVLCISMIVFGLIGTRLSIIRKPVLMTLPLLSASLIFVPNIAVANRFLAGVLTVAVAATSWRQLRRNGKRRQRTGARTT